MSSPSKTALDIEQLRQRCGTACFGREIHYLETTESTNTVAHELARAGAAAGTVVIAEMQTKGRGRLGRSWVSPPYRNLYVSVLLRPPLAPSATPVLALVAGLATAEVVREWTPRAGLKWPNDVVIDGRKVAGILMEMEADAERVLCVIAGIGVNLNIGSDEFPDDLRDKAIGLCTAAGAAIDRVAFTARLLQQFERRYALLLQEGFGAIRPLWEELSCLQGRRVEIDDGGRRYAGTVVGLGDDGTLRLVDAAGSLVGVVAGEVTVIGGYEQA